MSDTSGLEASRNLHPFLIIGPGCVLYNWLEELDTWGYFAVRFVELVVGIEYLHCYTIRFLHLVVGIEYLGYLIEILQFVGGI